MSWDKIRFSACKGLDDIKAAGATRLEARNSPGFRALANRLQLSGEYDANGGMYGVTR